MVFVWFGEQGGKSGILSLRRPGTSFGPPFHGLSSPVSGWPLLLELKMRKEVAFVQPRRFSVLVMNLMGRVCLPLCTLSISGAVPPEHAHRQLGHHSSRREHFFLWESLNERPVCSQSESFGFGKVSSFQQGRVGTRKELNNTRERRSESERRWEGIGVTKGCTAAPLSSFPNLTGHLVCQTLPELPVAAPPSSWWWPLAA